MCHLILFLPVFALPVFWLLPFSTAMTIYLIISGFSLLMYFLIFKAMMMKPRVGKEAMLGKTGIVIKDIAPVGKIKYDTEIWDAMAKGKDFEAGEKVIIHGFSGMCVLVKEIPAFNDNDIISPYPMDLNQSHSFLKILPGFRRESLNGR